MRRTCRKVAWLCILLLMIASPLSKGVNAGGVPIIDEPFYGQSQAVKEQAKGPKPAQAAKKTSACNPAAEKLRADLRKLWTDHAYWTRNVLVSSLAGLEDTETGLTRLLHNQQDIGNAVKPYYGEEAGNRLADLLREQIRIAGRLVEAVQKGHREDTYKYKTDWYRNAEDIALFLNQANPAWPVKELKALLDRHLDLVARSLNARLNQDWQADIHAFDEGEDHLIKLADVLTEGIVKQFPERFGMAGKK